MSLETDVAALLAVARIAARKLALASTEQKNAALTTLAAMIRKSKPEILAANRSDLERAHRERRSGPMIERLTLNDDRIEAIARGVSEVAALPDPVGATIDAWQRPNGLKIEKRRVPIGLIAIIYESRPNVTVDAAALCLKSGNAVVLRGGKEALASNACLAGLVARALKETGLDPSAAMFIDNPEREIVQILKRSREALDLIIPRGGRELKAALEGSAVALLPHFEGICHTYVDASADLKMAEEICFNAKCSRPSVCNAMETLLVHRGAAASFLPGFAARMKKAGVEIRGDEHVRAIVRDARAATPEDWDTEYWDLILSIKVVDSLDEAIAFIERHGSHLADAIVTRDPASAARFQHEVDSATVYVNASTRFTDGFEFGFGAETGISTNRLHARGPMGLAELTTYKYVIHGSGQVRG
ncbi:MAG: glutamate-5-semialdehyde dehydrogenase [Candidatus Binataceae bacterium]